MVKFNSLYITSAGDNLVLNVSIEDLSYYTNVYISNVYIDNQNTFEETGKSDSPLYSYSVKDTDTLKTLSLTVPSTSILADLKNDLLFVWIVLKGTVSADTPCGMDSMSYVKAVYNQRRIADYQLPFIKEIDNSCCIPKNFIDMVLQKEALDMAVSTGHNITAISFWKKFFTDTDISITSTCSCHG